VRKSQETHLITNDEKEKWIEDYAEIETTVATKWVEDAETAIDQEQDDMRNAEKAELTTTKPETTFQEMLNTIRDSLSDLASSDNGKDGEDEDDDEEDAAGGKLSEDDETGWVMGTICKTVQHRMERFREKQTKLAKLTHPSSGDAADYFPERDKEYGTTDLKVLAVVQHETADDAASSVPKISCKPLETLDSIPGILQMPQVSSWPGSSRWG